MNHPAPKYASNEGVAEAIRAALGEVIVDLVEAVGEISVTVTPEALPDAMVKLRDDLAYQQLMEIAGVDYPAILAQLRDRGITGINPLLSEAEHRELFVARDPFRIVELILRGFANLAK